MALVSWSKSKREALPLIFFGTVVSTKLYFLVKILFVDGGWYRLTSTIQYSQSGDDQLTYLALNMVSYVFYSLVAILFDSLVFASYLIRLEPTNKAKGFWERAYPLATVLLPVTGFTLLAIPDVRAQIPTYDPRTLALRYELSPNFFILVNISGLILGAIGATLSFVALWSLKRSFSLMAEVRELVTSGLYKRIRHPLYMAEIIHIFGLAILSSTVVGYWLFGIAVAMQVGRAKIEERKFLRTVPEYAEFRGNTGFLWPKLW
jgi:protein-S-isoprenylcysteine O-methyltransferase Ste14